MQNSADVNDEADIFKMAESVQVPAQHTAIMTGYLPIFDKQREIYCTPADKMIK